MERNADGGWGGLAELPEFLRRVVGARCRDESEVDDVVQEACLRAARYRGSLGDPGRLRPWAARIAVNVLADRAGRSACRRPGPLEQAGDLIDPSGDERPPEARLRVGSWLLDRDQVLAELRIALGHLKEEDRRLLTTFYGAGESCRRAGSLCGVAPDRVKVRLFRARRRLQRILRRRVSRVATRWVDPAGEVHRVEVVS